MKYLKIFENFKDIDIDSICRNYNIRNYTINKDGSIDVNGDVDLYDRDLTKLPLKFGYVSGYFHCGYNQLTSLEGSPQSIGGNFGCYNNHLTSLEGSPKSVGGHFWCDHNQLTSLEGSPQVGGNFDCRNNPVYSLVSSWIDGRKRNEMLEYFTDLDMFRGNSVIFIRLKDFMETFDMEIDMDKVKKHYKVI